MKKVIYVLLLLGFIAVSLTASAQNGDFSDWNVPPPMPPGRMNKTITPGKLKTTVVVPVVDLPSFPLPKTAGVKLGKLAPVSSEIPEVAIPKQPAFPTTPTLLAEIPLPDVPEAPGLSGQAPQDKINNDVIDIPVPEAPDMPDMPKAPIVTSSSSAAPVEIPVTPLLPTQVAPVMSTDFPFTDWLLPLIPVSTNFNFLLPDSSDNANPKPKAIQKAKRPPHRSN
ncbi:MAG: hypothetical protein M3O71_09120 [Bacteroidota bacterium]|nr:hypothetical protein [Bacteroidota bacterium]